MKDEGAAEGRQAREWGRKAGLLRARAKHARGAGLIQNGPRRAALASDPRDTTGWPCARAPAGEGAVLPLQHPLKAPPPRPAAGPVEAGGLSTPPSLPPPLRALACARTSCPPERSGSAGFLGFAGQGYWQSHPVPKALRPRIAPPSGLPCPGWAARQPGAEGGGPAGGAGRGRRDRDRDRDKKREEKSVRNWPCRTETTRQHCQQLRSRAGWRQGGRNGGEVSMV